jgi:hypothetical protein
MLFVFLIIASATLFLFYWVVLDCDHALQSSATLANAGNCNTPCSGNSAELCGAGNFVDVYWNGAPIPVVPQQVGTWKYDGCFSYVFKQHNLNLTFMLSPVIVPLRGCSLTAK